MDCTQARNYMHGHLDGELDPVTAAATEEHMHSCAACKHAYAQLLSLQTAVKKHSSYYQAPDALAQRIRAEVDAASGTKMAASNSSRWQSLQIGAAVAATAVITWTAAIQWQVATKDDNLVEEVIASHARSAVTGHLADVASSDQHTVKPWLSSKLDFSPPVTDLTTAGFPLVGGRLDYLDHRPVAALVYRHRQHLINVYIWPDSKSDTTTPGPATSKQGYNLLHWHDRGMTFWAISDLNPADIGTFAQTLTAIK